MQVYYRGVKGQTSCCLYVEVGNLINQPFNLSSLLAVIEVQGIVHQVFHGEQPSSMKEAVCCTHPVCVYMCCTRSAY